jgi:PAS domain S-box-containing protein
LYDSRDIPKPTPIPPSFRPRPGSAVAGMAGVLLTAALFVLDCVLPYGVLDGILYAVPVLFGLWVPGTRYAPAAAGAATALNVATFFVGKASLVPLGFALVDRLVAVGLVWLIAGAIVWKKRRDETVERLSAIVESSGDAIIGIALDGTVTSWNAGAERLYGYASAEIVGRLIADFQPRAAAEWEEYLSRIAHGEAFDHVEARRVRKDGGEIWVSLRVSPVRDASGRVAGASVIARDISRRRYAESRLGLVLSNAPVVLFSLDRNGIITFCEGQPLTSLGRAPEKLVGRSSFELFGHHEWVVAETRRVLAGEAFTGGGAAEGRWWENHYAPILGGGGQVTGGIAVAIDVTDRKEAEEKVVRQEALARLGSMAAVVAHEVKNPLAGIGGAVQVLRDRLPAGAPDRGIMTEVLGRLGGLNALVQDLLDFARPRTPRFARFAVVNALRDTAALLTRDPAFAGLPVTIDGDDVTLTGDADLLRDVFHNLLLNGAQATGGAGPLAVAVAETGGRCIVSFRDRGPGIPDELREKVFEPFFTTKHRGTGLGLSIARRIVEAHGGTLRLETPPDGGTVARVELPLSRD